MGCCGKAKKAVRKARNITAGYVNLATGKRYEFIQHRLAKCSRCDEQTWMSGVEYSQWMLRHGVKVIANFTELEKLPRLPKQKRSGKRDRSFCRLCKCYILAAIRVKNKKCLLGKW